MANSAQHDMIVVTIAEIVGDYADRLSHDGLVEIINADINEFAALEGIRSINFTTVAKKMVKRVHSDGGWTLNDLKFLRYFFSTHGAKFGVVI